MKAYTTPIPFFFLGKSSISPSHTKLLCVVSLLRVCWNKWLLEKTVNGLEFKFMSLHANYSIFNWLIQEAISFHMITFLFLLEMYGQRSQVYPQWGLIWKRTAMIHALKGPDIFIHMSNINSSVLPFLWSSVYMHNITETLLINVDISMETYL